MFTNKINYTRLILFALLFLLQTGCRKSLVRSYYVRVRCEIPYSNTPIKGLRYTIKEYKVRSRPIFSSKITPTGWELVAETDETGVVSSRFSRRRAEGLEFSGKYDFSHMQIPYAEWKTATFNPSFSLEDNHPIDLLVKILPLMNVTFHFKNLNCTGLSDVFRFKIQNIDDGGVNYDWSFSWSETPLYQGCCDVSYNASNKITAGRFVILWEAERNSVFESGIDTFLVTPETTNTINMFW